LFNLPARETVRGRCKLGDAEFLRVTVALGDVNAPDGFTLRLVGQVNAPNVHTINERVRQTVNVV
jgi:hypothetical protein